MRLVRRLLIQRRLDIGIPWIFKFKHKEATALIATTSYNQQINISCSRISLFIDRDADLNKTPIPSYGLHSF